MFVSKKKYQSVVNQLTLAEAKIREFEAANAKVTKKELLKVNKETKPVKKIEVKDGTETGKESSSSKYEALLERKARAQALKAEGKTVREIATELGVSTSTVYSYL